MKTISISFIVLFFVAKCGAFAPVKLASKHSSVARLPAQSFRLMAEQESNESVQDSIDNNSSSITVEGTKPAVEEEMDAATKLALEKQKRADELRSQEVFMKRSTGIHKCSNCDWEYDVNKGDSFMIGGMIKPGTPFSELPSNWRCPTCRASKDSFQEVTEEIPGFAVNQGYGFGGNSLTAGQKSGLVFGGLFLFFVLFLAGYGLS
jgi:rubredoxin